VPGIFANVQIGDQHDMEIFCPEFRDQESLLRDLFYSSLLPKICSLNLGGAGLPIDYLCAQHNLHILLVASSLCFALYLGQITRVG
jgi:hypothetical protein